MITPALAILGGIVLLAFVVESTAGFGATIVTVTLAAQLFPLDTVLAAFVPVNVVLSFLIVVRNVRHVDRSFLVRRVLPWVALGTAAGLALSRFRDAPWIKLVFAAFVVVLSVVELVGLARKREEPVTPLTTPVAIAALLSGGVIHGLFACGGPMIVYVVGRTLQEKSAFRATLSALWLVMNLALIVTMVAQGSIGAASLRTSAMMIVPLGLGLAIGNRLHDHVPERTFRVSVFILLLCAALVLFARSL